MQPEIPEEGIKMFIVSLIVKDKRTLKKIKGAIIRKAVRLDKAK